MIDLTYVHQFESHPLISAEIFRFYVEQDSSGFSVSVDRDFKNTYFEIKRYKSLSDNKFWIYF